MGFFRSPAAAVRSYRSTMGFIGSVGSFVAGWVFGLPWLAPANRVAKGVADPFWDRIESAAGSGSGDKPKPSKAGGSRKKKRSRK